MAGGRGEACGCEEPRGERHDEVLAHHGPAGLDTARWDPHCGALDRREPVRAQTEAHYAHFNRRRRAGSKVRL